MAGRIWDGGNVAQEMLKKVRDEIVTLQREGCSPPTLAEIWVGASPLDKRLRALQEDACQFTGISHHLRTFPLDTDHDTIIQALAALNADPRVIGIVVHAPSPSHTATLAIAVAPLKDVDGLHPLNIGRFITNKCPPRATRGRDVLELLKRAGIELVGAHVICIGNASGFGNALALLCLHENATITAWRSATAWPSKVLGLGDLLVIDSDDIPALHSSALKPGGVVIDARGSAEGWAQMQHESWLDAVSLLIPVPGGVGPTTVAMRLSSVVTMYRTQARGQPDL